MKAYLALRKHAEEFLTLWHLILTAGLKEVNKASHLEHLTTVSIHSVGFNLLRSLTCSGYVSQLLGLLAQFQPQKTNLTFTILIGYQI